MQEDYVSGHGSSIEGNVDILRKIFERITFHNLSDFGFVLRFYEIIGGIGLWIRIGQISGH